MAARLETEPDSAAEHYTWADAPLSTRSLSYVSTVSALASTLPANGRPYEFTRNPSTVSETLTWRAGDMEDVQEDDSQMLEGEDLPANLRNSLLFQLPRELRERIYQYCLGARETPVVEWPTQSGHTIGINWQILLICRTMYEEAIPWLFSQNIFGFNHPSDANIFGRCVVPQIHVHSLARLNLHVRTQDTRLWMTYLTSSDAKRSLQHDFPGLHELTIQYRSVRWSGQAPLDTNMRIWSEDRHLDELIVGLRHVFFDPYQGLSTAGLSDEQIVTLRNYEDEDYEMQDVLRDVKVRNKLKEIRERLTVKLAEKRAPRIRVICMCRVPLAHFQALTAPAQVPSNIPAPQPAAGQDHQMLFQQDPATRRATTPPLPAREGDNFTGFTQVDLRGRAKRLSFKDFPGGAAAWAAKTVFLNRKNIMLALQIHTFENI